MREMGKRRERKRMWINLDRGRGHIAIVLRKGEAEIET
jgi:hypothetical protein